MEHYNIAQTLAEVAARAPHRRAVVYPAGRDRQGRARYVQLSFEQLNQECDRYAHGLAEYGVRQGDRTLLMARPSLDFIAVVFALLKVGAVPVLIDPGQGRKVFLQCVAETEPTVFIGLPLAHVLRKVFPRPFRTVRLYVTMGRRWFWGGATLEQLRTQRRDPFPVAPTTTESEGAVAFTSGSTGIPKGVVYLHGMFRAQVELLRQDFGIAEGEVDLPGLYIFALFNPALGVTTVFPDMDPTKPAHVNPAYLVEAIQTHGVTNSFGSPTIWKRVGEYCRENDVKLPSIKRILMASAPVPPALVASFERDILQGGEVNTPFGASEAVPITMMSGSEIVAETAQLSEQGAGMCVGRAIRGHSIRVIGITDEPIPEWDEALALPQGQVGEIVVQGPVVTRLYLSRPRQTALAKINDQDGGVWHRMGDLGYFDEQGRLWFCGRKDHRVETPQGLMLPVPCEAIFNQHPGLARSALVGVGPLGRQRPVLVVEPRQSKTSTEEQEKLAAELLELGAAHEHARGIKDVLFYPAFPVDVRHNAKIQREKLAAWAEKQLR